MMGRGGRNEALEAKKQKKKKNRDSRLLLVEEEEFQAMGFSSASLQVRIREKHSENTQQVPKHFPSHPENCTWQLLMAATAGSCAEEHAAHAFLVLCI